MNKLLLILAFTFIALGANAQTYGNEWIDFTKTYFKIKVGQEGIYRLTYDNLNNVGFPVSSIDPRRIQLYHRGVEVAIFVEGENDAVFNPTDYIDFYGQANDGTLDANLYQPASTQPHSYYNLYSDTTAYFLTYNLVATNGKRMATSTPFTGGANDTYHLKENLTVYSDNYSQGETQASFNSLTTFGIGEGFTGARIIENSSPVRDIVIVNVNQTAPSAPSPQLKLLLVGRNEQTHNITIQVGPSTGSLTILGTYDFVEFENLLIDEPISWTDIAGTGELTVRITVNTNGGANSNISVSYIKLDYGQGFDMSGASGKKYVLDAKATGGNDVRITNVPTNAMVLDITNPENVLIVIDTEIDANIIKCGFSDATSARTLWVNDLNPIEPVLEPISFRQMSTSANYIIISHSLLMKPASGFLDAVRAYAGYRTTTTGGGFDTLVVDIQQLYNQFSYGEITPLSIYNFMEFMVDKGSPQHLFIIGKSLLVGHKFYRRPLSDFTYYDLVPTAGQPGADATFTVGLNGSTTYESAVPTGRLSASSPNDVINYLNKVIEHESLPFDQLWRKKLIHLSGGNSESELAIFRGYVDGYKTISQGLFLGGEVVTQSKTTSEPVEFINVSEEVNSGLNQITFFGHSAPNVTDIDIGFVSDPANGYNNKGKYPLILMNGCNAGNIYLDEYIFGEDWVLTPNLGSTAVIAHTSFGFSSILNRWSSLFYTIGYSDINYMDKSIGAIMQETGRQLSAVAIGSSAPFYIAQIQQMALHGDPAIKLFGTQIPDYDIIANNVQPVALTNQGITAEADSFALKLGVRNFGAYLNDSLEVFVRRTLQNGTIIDYDTITYKPVRNTDTLTYIISNNFEDNFGTNSFEIVLDPANKLTEHSKINNRIFYNYFIPLSGTINLSPANYSIVTSKPISLMAQISSQPSESRTVEFELDANPDFSSTNRGEASGTLITEWSGFTIPDTDSVAYYWRSKYKDLAPGESDDWSESSFTYIKEGDEGWAQVENAQIANNSLSGLVIDDATKKLKFIETLLDIEVKTFGAKSALTNEDVEFLIDGQAFILGSSFQSCADNRLAIVAFNHKNASPYAPIFGGQVDTWTCGRSPQVINIVDDVNGTLLDQVLDAIKPNDYVLVFTIGQFDFNLGGIPIAKLEDLGADASILSAKLPDEPYMLYGRKGIGAGNSTLEIIAEIAPEDEQIIRTPPFTSVVGSTGKGVMKSVQIGPAFSWDRLTFDLTGLEANDDYDVDIIGKTLDGNETILSAGIKIKETPLDFINPIQYPYIHLQYHVLDTIDKTPVQLDKWLVNYTPAPEGVIVYLGNDASSNLQVELQEGDSLFTEFGFINITDKSFQNELQVEYTIFNSSQRISISKTIFIDAPEPSDTTKFKIPIRTKGLIGINNLSVFVNNFVEPEQLFVNNTISLTNYLTVLKDETNPLLDVSFDGRYIYDGEIVSATPSVLIKILDENPLLQKTDTTGINLFITRPCEGCGQERIKLSDIYQPASKDKPFEINYKPGKLENGVYTLSIHVEDASGNSAGAEPYTINFEVINEATVTNFYPYPNPFSTSVKFVFTLTGSELPDGIKIQILTVSGRVVRTITQDEIGPIHIGNNQTDFAWDGRDEFGDQLANGVYLYKVTLRLNGENVTLRSSAGDKGFKNGYGKMYLLR